MKYIYLLLISFTVLSLSFSCDKKEESQVYYYNETSCNNPWDSFYTSSKQQAVEDFLVSENIHPVAIESHTDTSMAATCLACSCTTGSVIEVEVNAGDESKMKDLGFYK